MIVMLFQNMIALRELDRAQRRKPINCIIGLALDQSLKMAAENLGIEVLEV
jgi:hypothetical protein